MKLNANCVRDIMLELETALNETNVIVASGFKCKNYSSEEIIYTISKLLEAGFLNASKMCYDNQKDYIISSISYNGHQFIDNIRSNTAWSLILKNAKKFGIFSISSLASIAINVTAELISNAIKSNGQ